MEIHGSFFKDIQGFGQFTSLVTETGMSHVMPLHIRLLFPAERRHAVSDPGDVIPTFK